MPKPTESQLYKLGNLVQPFERTGFKRKILAGEDLKEPFDSFIYDATNNHYPNNVLLSNPEEVMVGKAENTKYLWIIDQNGLFIIPEQTANSFTVRGVVCHTNLTGGGSAIQGGELWFGTDGVVYINNKSGRYGATTLEERYTILDYFGFVGYKNVQQLI